MLHVADKTNPADIFTKEIRDGPHFWHLRDFLMCRLSDFLSTSVLAIHHTRQQSSHSVAPAAASGSLFSDNSPPLPLRPFFGLSPTSLICQVLVDISFVVIMVLVPHLSSNVFSELIRPICCAIFRSPLTFFLLLDARMGDGIVKSVFGFWSA
jgi:hypothetical protein